MQSFQLSWVYYWNWVHYDAAIDVCFLCCKAAKQGKIKETLQVRALLTGKMLILWLCNQKLAIMYYISSLLYNWPVYNVSNFL